MLYELKNLRSLSIIYNSMDLGSHKELVLISLNGKN